MSLHADSVAHWLQSNPAFFEDYADLIAQIFIPHPHGGRAIPIAERQILALRDKSRMLEGKLGELIQFGQENDLRSEKIHRLSLALLRARDASGVLGSLYAHLQEDFHIPHLSLRLWGEEPDATLLEFSPVSEEVRALAQALHTPYCGPQISDEAKAWFGETGPHLKSYAQLALSQDGEAFGMLVLGSEQAQRFYPGMATVDLARVGELSAAALVRCLF